MAIVGSALVNVAIHGLLVWRARGSTVTSFEPSLPVPARRFVGGLVAGLVVGALLALGVSWYLPRYVALDDDTHRGTRYSETLQLPDLPRERRDNFIRGACESEADVIYGNSLFDDSTGDWAPPDQKAFYAGCTAGVADSSD